MVILNAIKSTMKMESHLAFDMCALFLARESFSLSKPKTCLFLNTIKNNSCSTLSQDGQKPGLSTILIGICLPSQKVLRPSKGESFCELGAIPG